MKSIRILTSSIIWLLVVAAIISVKAVAFEGAVTPQAVDGEARMTTRSPVSELDRGVKRALGIAGLWQYEDR